MPLLPEVLVFVEYTTLTMVTVAALADAVTCDVIVVALPVVTREGKRVRVAPIPATNPMRRDPITIRVVEFIASELTLNNMSIHVMNVVLSQYQENH